MNDAEVNETDRDGQGAKAAQLDERRRIVEAAWRVLDRSGFQGLKVGSVVRAVPISTREFYRWFADKDDLTIELVCEEYQRAGRRLAALMGEAPPEVAVHRWIEGYFLAATEPSLTARARLFASLRSAAPGESQRSTEALDEFLAPLRTTVERGCHDGTFTTTNPRADSMAIHHLCAGSLLDALRLSDTDALAWATDSVERVASFVLRALGVNTQ